MKKKGYRIIIHNEEPHCYVIGCKHWEDFQSFQQSIDGGKTWHAAYICSYHYDKLARIQNKPLFEEKQKKKVDGTLKDSDMIEIPTS